MKCQELLPPVCFSAAHLWLLKDQYSFGPVEEKGEITVVKCSAVKDSVINMTIKSKTSTFACSASLNIVPITKHFGLR